MRYLLRALRLLAATRWRSRRRGRSRSTRLRRCASSRSTAAGTCRSGRRSARASSRRTASRVQLSYTPTSAYLDHGAARRPVRHRARRDRQPRRLPGRAGRGEDRRQPRPVRVHRRRRRIRVGRRGAGGQDFRRPQGQDGVGRRDDHRFRVRPARAARAQRRRRNRREVRARRRHVEPLSRPARRQARRHAAAHAVRAAARERGFNVLATAESLGAYQGTVGLARRSWARDHEAALVGFIRGYRAGVDWLYDRAQPRRSSRRCSSPTSAT